MAGGEAALVIVTGEGRKTGKTSLGAALVARLAGLGLRVAVLKHVHHGVDYRVRDTGRYLEAGAPVVAALGPGEYMVVRRGQPDPWSLVAALAREADVVVVEGLRGWALEALERGGCMVYLCRSGCARLHAGGRVEQLSRVEAEARLAELVASGACRVRLP